MSSGSELRVVFRALAEREIEGAAEWYDVRQAGLGAEFLNAVEAAIAAILQNPEAHREVRSGMRRAVLRRFPYNLVYAVGPSNIVVLGCIHGRRDPRIWQHRE